MYRIALLLFVLLHSTLAFAQGHRLYGEVTGDGNNPLSGINIELLREHTYDKRVAVTDIQGRFAIDNVPKGRYLLRISSINYTTYLASINLSADLNVGRINIADTAFQMAEVKINGTITPLRQSNDTTTYNAKAYKSFADADAYYLLNKMPGFKMLDDKILFDDDSVSKLLLNGEVLFNNDIVLGLKSIPASAVETVQTYNDKSDKEKLTGYKEDKNTKVIDIKTKDNFKLPTGKAYAGAGDNEAYTAGTNLNRVVNGEQIAIQGLSNNVNYRPMTMPDPEQRNAPSGINRKTSASFNYSKAISKKVNVGLVYSYYRNGRSEDDLTQRQYLLPEDQGKVYSRQTYLDDLSQSHNAMANISYQPAPSTTIRLRTDLDHRSGKWTNNSSIVSYNFSNTNIQTTTNRSPNITNSLSLTHGFRKKGRSIDIKLGQGYHTFNNENIQTGTTYAIGAISIDQRRIMQTTGGGAHISITFTEPVNKWNLLEVNYNANKGNSNIQQQTLDFSAIDQAYTILNDSLSNILVGNNVQHNAGLKHKYQKNKIIVSLGLNMQLMQLSGKQTLPVSFHIDRTFRYLLPDASFQYQFTNTRSLKFSYNTSVYPFKVSALAGIVDNTDPMQYHAGNPSLKPEYNHNMRTSYQSTNNTTGTRFTYSLSGIFKQYRQTEQILTPLSDTIILGTSVAKGTKLIVPLNLGDYQYISNRASYSTPLTAIKCNLKSEGEIFHSRGSFMINNETAISRATGGNVTLELSSNISEQLDFSVSSSTTFHSTNYSVATFANDRFFQQVSGLFAHYSFWENYYISTQASFLYYHSSSVNVYNRMDLVDMSIGCKVLKKKGDIKLVAHDIFNQNKKVEHNNTATYIEDIRTIGIQRYFMLIFTYIF